MLRTVQRLQFHLQKPCIMRVGSEIDFVSADDIRRLLPRLAGGIATAATAAMDKFESECYAIGSARLVVPDGGVTVLCKMTYVEHEVYGDQVRIDMAGRTDCPSISERFGLSCGAITPIMTFFTVPDAKDLPDAPAVVFFDELARLIGVFPDDCGDGHDKEDADDHELEQRDVDEESAVLAVMDAGKERRLRMALTLVTCIIGPATRYDGLRCPSDEDFWDGLKPRMWFHTDPVEVLLTHCVQVWADEQTTGFA